MANNFSSSLRAKISLRWGSLSFLPTRFLLIPDPLCPCGRVAVLQFSAPCAPVSRGAASASGTGGLPTFGAAGTRRLGSAYQSSAVESTLQCTSKLLQHKIDAQRKDRWLTGDANRSCLCSSRASRISESGTVMCNISGEQHWRAPQAAFIQSSSQHTRCCFSLLKSTLLGGCMLVQ